MPADISDLLTGVVSDGNGRAEPTALASQKVESAPSISCDDLSTWEDETAVHFAIYQKDNDGKKIASTQTDWKGVVSGNTITNIVLKAGNDQVYPVGATVECMPTAAWAEDLIAALLASMNQDGSLKKAALASSYPIGSLYFNATNDTNPGDSSMLGFGTWVAFGAGRVPVGFNSGDSDFNAGEKTGGAKTHTLTIDQIPSHFHSIPSKANSAVGSGGRLLMDNGSGSDGLTATNSAGGGQAHNIMQPFITVYMWKRTA